MTEIFEFIVTNYFWILVIVLITLLSIIGSFAEKSLFETAKKEEKKKEEQTIDLSDKKMSDFFGESNKDKSMPNQNNEIGQQISTNTAINNNPDAISNSGDLVNQASIGNAINMPSQSLTSNNNIMSNLESKLSSLDKQINDMLPKKELIEEDLLEDVEDINLDIDKKPGKKKDELNLDDIKLPNIKSSKSSKKSLWN